jgi:folate-dependent phosphoribosylglycinamide formyltransferase PurN
MITDSVQVPKEDVRPFEYKKENGIVALMDCGGSNVAKINEQIPGVVKLIGTGRINHPEVKAKQRAEELGVQLVEIDFRQEEEKLDVGPGDYYKAITKGKTAEMKGKRNPLGAIGARNDICKRFLGMLYAKMDEIGIPRDTPVFTAGFMQLVSKEFADSLRLENVHPGDLTIHELRKRYFRGKRVVVGDAWVPPAIAISAGHQNLYSSMHQLTYEMDSGPVHMRGYAFPMDYNRLLSMVDIKDREVLEAVGGAAQEALKHIGDHVVAGATFQDFFDGNWGEHMPTGVHSYRFDGKWYLAPNGIRIEDHVANNAQTPFKRDRDFVDGKIEEFWKEVEGISAKYKA